MHFYGQPFDAGKNIWCFFGIEHKIFLNLESQVNVCFPAVVCPSGRMFFNFAGLYFSLQPSDLL